LLKSERRELETELQLILNAVVKGVCGLDGKGKATFCNEALLKMTGYRSAEVIGKNPQELLHHSRLDGTRHPLEECAAAKAVDDRCEIHIEGEFFWRKDGTCFPTEDWAHPVEMPSTLTAYVATILVLSEWSASFSAASFCVTQSNLEAAERGRKQQPFLSW
jgi:PAS domain S-box-containing protein